MRLMYRYEEVEKYYFALGENCKQNFKIKSVRQMPGSNLWLQRMDKKAETLINPETVNPIGPVDLGNYGHL